MYQRAKNKRKNKLKGTIKENIRSTITIFISVVLLKCFVAEGFVIPTGSMADSLRGDHFQITCPTCSHQYNFGFIPQNYMNEKTGKPYPENSRPAWPINVKPDRLANMSNCPMCGSRPQDELSQKVARGDQILALKSYYDLFEPKMWDVIIFEDVGNTDRTIIKRLIGLPGQTVEIIDGDVYIDGLIAGKPLAVQEVLWGKIFDNDYQLPDHKATGIWRQPFRPTQKDTAWQIDQKTKKFEFTGAENFDVLEFSPKRLEQCTQLVSTYNGTFGDLRCLVSDLKLQFAITPSEPAGKVVMTLGKYGRKYDAEINFDGTCRIKDVTAGITLAEKFVEPLKPNKPIEVSFANVDHRLELQVGPIKCIYEGPRTPQGWGHNNQDDITLPSVALAAKAGRFSMSHIALFRDIHYSNAIGQNIGRGTEGHPFKLGHDEFFVMGDNTLISYDSRFWRETNDKFRPGVLPRDHILGRALLVYWPAGFQIHPSIPIAFIPNTGQMRWIR